MLLLLAATLSSQAQSPRYGKVTGKLLDADTHEPIPNAHIVLLRASDKALISSTTTRSDGTFVVSKVPFGQYSFRTTILGYRSHYPRIDVQAKQPSVALGTVALQPLNTQLATAPTVGSQSLLAAAR
ncbi:hypothetical protein GCM10022408_04770 [Hymenobacter fastidiosus]|uniref:Carboxypeptidase regulatory-like domain-containing protein n=1 Tax=Hymenobacter fastidiosus TaxID=486264 RepID=A0ABP7RGD3_9BACT